MISATYATVKSLTRRAEGVNHKLYMDNFFSPYVSDDLHTRDLNFCRTVGKTRKGIPGGFDNKTLKLKWGDMY
jgi:hypothetical protein